MRKVLVMLTVLAMVGGMAAYADTLKKGDKEMNFNFSYAKISPDEGDDITLSQFAGAMGYLITDGNEVGLQFAYQKQDYGGGDSSDSNTISAFYHYNFKAGETMNPYLGVLATTYGGDMGDSIDMSYGIQGGVKVYPWSNAGFNFGVQYEQLMGANDGGDATNVAAFGGVLIKF